MVDSLMSCVSLGRRWLRVDVRVDPGHYMFLYYRFRSSICWLLLYMNPARMRMGVGTVAGGASMYLLRTLQKRLTRTSPSFILTGALVAVGAFGGAVAGVSVSNYSEREVWQGISGCILVRTLISFHWRCSLLELVVL